MNTLIIFNIKEYSGLVKPKFLLRKYKIITSKEIINLHSADEFLESSGIITELWKDSESGKFENWWCTKILKTQLDENITPVEIFKRPYKRKPKINKPTTEKNNEYINALQEFATKYNIK